MIDALGARLPPIDELRRMALPPAEPREGALAGTPAEAAQELFDDGRTEIGVWTCTPGRFPTAKDGIGELMHVLDGRGTLTSDDGVVQRIEPGAVLLTPDGYRGTWDIEETVRKLYVIWKTAA